MRIVHSARKPTGSMGRLRFDCPTSISTAFLPSPRHTHTPRWLGQEQRGWLLCRPPGQRWRHRVAYGPSATRFCSGVRSGVDCGGLLKRLLLCCPLPYCRPPEDRDSVDHGLHGSIQVLHTANLHPHPSGRLPLLSSDSVKQYIKLCLFITLVIT